MTRVGLIREIFMFFARFPEKAGVQSIFNKGRSDDLPAYSDWLAQVNAMPDVSLQPDIKHYVFGVDAAAVKTRITQCNDFFLFVDYGQIDNSVDDVNRRRESFYIALTVAYPSRDSDNDLAERAVRSDYALDLLLDIRRQMIAEEKCIPWLKNFQADHVITPWVADEMPSYGWTVIIKRQGFDMLKGK